MRDTKLFQYIQTLIRERHNSSPTESTTFAERYCKEQMMKKKLNANNSGQKMAHLMRNFQGLETFVDLPELIEAVKVWRYNQIMSQKQQLQRRSQQMQRQSFSCSKRRQVKSLSVFKYEHYIRTDKCLELQSKLKKELGQKMKSKYLIQNAILDDLISSLQKTTTINSAALKNDSPNNINTLYQKVADESKNTDKSDEMGFLDCLNNTNSGSSKKKQDNKNRISDWLQLQNNQSQDNSLFQTSIKLRKQYSKLLHKISTYIQIALQMEHRQKWETKSQSHHTHKLHKNIYKTHRSDKDKENRQFLCGNVNKGNQINTNNTNNNSSINNTTTNSSDNSVILLHSTTPIADKPKDKLQHSIVHNTSTSNIIKFKSKFVKQQLPKLQANPQSVAFHQREQKNNMLVQSGSMMTKLKKKPLFLHRRQISQYPQELNINTPLNYNHIRNTTTSILANTPIKSTLRSSEGNDSFLRTTSSSTLKQEATRIKKANYKSEGKQPTTSSFSIPKNLPKSTFQIKENFTFRNRNIKQRIIKRLDSFIREIDDQEQNNKKQNNFYVNAINKLENTLGLSYGQFRQEAVAGEKDIEAVTKYAKLYGNGCMRSESPNIINLDDDSTGDQKNSKAQIN